MINDHHDDIYESPQDLMGQSLGLLEVGVVSPSPGAGEGRVGV